MRPDFSKPELFASALTLALFAQLHAAPAAAITRLWDGNGANDNWGYFTTIGGIFAGNTNWTADSNSPLPFPGDSLVFQGSTRLTPFNDLGGLTIGGIVFAPGAGAFTLNGNGILNVGSIFNASSNLQTINLPIVIGSDQFWDGGAAGMTFGAKVQLGAKTLSINADGNANVTLAAGITGSGDLFKVGSGRLTLGGTSSSDGATYVNGGTLSVSAGVLLSSTSGTLGQYSGDSGTVTVSGAGAQWAVGGDLVVGDAGSGTLDVADGGKVTSTTGYLGKSAGGNGTVTIDGAGSEWTNTGELYVEGSSTLTVKNGGKLGNTYGYLGNNAGDNVVATVDGAKSQWTNSAYLYVGGQDANGTLHVTNGGQVSDLVGFLGNFNGGSGTVTVDGAGSQWSNKFQLFVGVSTNSELHITNGGKVTDQVAYLGYSSGVTGSATVDGANSAWANGLQLVVGEFGNGNLTILNGARVSSAVGIVGGSAGGKGVATVAGADAIWSNVGLTVGDSGEGTLNIGSGGAVEVGATLTIGNNGIVNLNGGRLSLASATVAPAGQFNWTAGTVSFTGALGVGGGAGGLFDGDFLSLNASQVLDVAGNASFAASSLVGVAGSLHVGGNLDSSGVLNVAAGGTATVGGTTTNSGTLVTRGTVQTQTLVDSGGIQLAGAGRLKVTTLNLEGGNISGAALVMDDIGTLTGHGAVASAVIGGTAATTIAASGGNLTLGNANTTSGFQFGGHLDVGSGQVTLLDKDKADLGIGTTLGDGGKLVTVNGANLAAGRTLSFTGNARIQGDFTNNGLVSGSGGALTFLNDVNGAGGFSGSIIFGANFDPGNSPAAVDFHGGDATVDTHSTLNLEIFGSTPGAQYDQLINIGTFAFHGALNLVFGNGFVPTAGETFQLFDFAAFEGAFDPARITVTGFDPALLNFSRLGIDGVLKVNAVPVPAAVWLFASAFAGLLGRRRQA